MRLYEFAGVDPHNECLDGWTTSAADIVTHVTSTVSHVIEMSLVTDDVATRRLQQPCKICCIAPKLNKYRLLKVALSVLSIRAECCGRSK